MINQKIKTKDKGARGIIMCKEKAKAWIKSHWKLLLFLSAIILLIGNIFVLLFVNESTKNTWLTLISGWVSGIATLFIGIIAYQQNYENDRASKKQHLISQITNYTSEFQIAFINYIRVERIIDLSRDIRACSLEPNSRVKDDMEFDINDALIYIINMFSMFEAVLRKASYCSKEIVELYELLNEMQKKFDDFGIDEIDEQYDDRYYFKEYRKRSEYIRKWIEKAHYIGNSIMMKYHDLRLKILKTENIKEIVEQIENEEQAIGTYFKAISEKQRNE